MYERSSAALMYLFVFLVTFIARPQPVYSETEPRIRIELDSAAGQMSVFIDNRQAFVYQHHKDVDLPHYWPMNSPSGKNMLVEQTEPYPHHRAFWFADKIRFDGGREADLYNALYSGTGGQRKPFKPYRAPFRQKVRHVEFTKTQASADRAVVENNLVWEIEYNKPVLDEHRSMRIRALGEGEYFLDITFTVTASYGPVEFVSDAVHYAWPYLRMNPTFSVDNGGTITNSEGGINQEGTHDQVARWVDYSNTVDGLTEGLTVFSHPSNGHPHKWLTRNYGTFGPRRVAERSGKPFTLEKGESLVQRVGILVHSGDVQDGKVAERYSQYVLGRLP